MPRRAAALPAGRRADLPALRPQFGRPLPPLALPPLPHHCGTLNPKTLNPHHCGALSVLPCQAVGGQLLRTWISWRSCCSRWDSTRSAFSKALARSRVTASSDLGTSSTTGGRWTPTGRVDPGRSPGRWTPPASGAGCCCCCCCWGDGWRGPCHAGTGCCCCCCAGGGGSWRGGEGGSCCGGGGWRCQMPGTPWIVEEDGSRNPKSMAASSPPPCCCPVGDSGESCCCAAACCCCCCCCWVPWYTSPLLAVQLCRRGPSRGGAASGWVDASASTAAGTPLLPGAAWPWEARLWFTCMWALICRQAGRRRRAVRTGQVDDDEELGVLGGGESNGIKIKNTCIVVCLIGGPPGERGAAQQRVEADQH